MPLHPPAAYVEELSGEDQARVEAILDEIGLRFATHDEYKVNRVTSQPIEPERVWKEVVRRAQELGYEAWIHAAYVTVQKP